MAFVSSGWLPSSYVLAVMVDGGDMEQHDRKSNSHVI